MLAEFLSLIAGFALLSGSPVSAQDTHQSPAETIPDFSQMNSVEALNTFRENGDRWIEQPCDFGVPLLAVMEKFDPGAIGIKRASLWSEALCADEEDRFSDGAAIVRALHELDPKGSNVSLILYFAERAKDGDLALDQFGWLRGKTFEGLERDRLWALVRMLRSQGRIEDFQKIAFSWFEDSQIAFIDSDLHSSLAAQALVEVARAGRIDMADEMLSYITLPSSYIDLLTDRRYEPLRRRIEDRAGINLVAVGAQDVEITGRQLTNAPTDRDRFSAAAHALHYHGEFQAAIDLAQTWRMRQERGLALEEGDGWALNIQAYAHDSLGQPDRADAIFDELAAVEADANPWVVNFVINRASRLVGQGRWEEGLKATSLARAVAADYGSTYAKMIIARDRACVLKQLGRTDEAAPELAYLRENSAEGLQFAVQGLLCHEQRDEAASMLIEGLQGTRLRSTAIGTLEAPQADLFYTQSILPNGRDLLAEYPELKALWAEHARDLPAQFVPRAATLRVTLNLPDWK